nr:hypothetical protein GCM10025699_61770 [Microbacterium flavescens]
MTRTLTRMAASPLRDPIEGGFFRYAVRRDWSEPHYERMLYDNAQLLLAYSRLSVLDGADADAAADARPQGAGPASAAVRPSGSAPASAAVPPSGSVPASATQAIGLDPTEIATGIADFLISRLRIGDGGFGSAQDSESTIDGQRDEGGYYRRDAAGRAEIAAPPVDEKVLTGWNGLAIAALAEAGARHDRGDWVAAAAGAADLLLERHVTPEGRLLRASTGTAVSTAVATLEDHGLFASGLLALTCATGLPRYAVAARSLVDACLPDDSTTSAVPGSAVDAVPADAERRPETVVAPAGGDPVLVSQGVALSSDPSEGAYPSGASAIAAAALTLHRLTGELRYRLVAEQLVGAVTGQALDNPLAYGATFGLLVELEAPLTQLVVVEPVEAAGQAFAADPVDPSDRLGRRARRLTRPGAVAAVVDEEAAVTLAEAGFELFAGRPASGHRATAYLCQDFVCRLPITDPVVLDEELAEH